eukprot:4700232-Pyramimonas_sp.AAC.1
MEVEGRRRRSRRRISVYPRRVNDVAMNPRSNGKCIMGRQPSENRLPRQNTIRGTSATRINVTDASRHP